MTRPSKRQCVLPISATSQTGKRTPSIAEQPPTIHNLNRQRIISLVQDDQCMFDVRPDGSVLMTPLKSYSLPNEIIALILDHLTDSQATLHQCTLVSKQCYAVANPLLWKAPVYSYSTVSTLGPCMDRMPLERRQALGHQVETLDLHDYWFGADTKQLLPYMPCLKRFMVDGNFIKMLAKDAAMLPKHCPALTSVRLDGVHLTKSTLMHFAKQGQLTDFEWIMSSRQDPTYLTHLAGCPLRRLAISFHFKPIDSLVRRAMLAFDQLTCLDLKASNNLPNNILKPTAFPRLTILRLRPCPHLSNSALVAFFQTHPLLEQLHFRSASKIRDTTLDAMHLLPLTHLTITYNDHITAPAVHRLINACPLTRVNLSGGKLMSSDFPAYRYEITSDLINGWELICR